MEMDCGRDKYLSKDGTTCCDLCEAGTHASSQCDATTKTECTTCKHGLYTGEKNYMKDCLRCRDCSSNNHKIAKECQAHEDRQCGCETGFHCMDNACVNCQAVTHCPVGEGVKVQATRTTDTVCAPCPPGTYSNVSDYYSPCKKHKSFCSFSRSCDVLKTNGSSRADAVCDDIKCSSWILPAGLWAGLVLTSLLIVLLGIIYWRVRRKSYRPAILRDPDVTVVPVTAAQFCPVKPSFPSREWDGHCQESSVEKDHMSPLFVPDDSVINRFTQDCVEDGLPRTPMTASVQIVQPSHVYGNAGNCSDPSMRNHSEPQEDEWG